MADTCDQPSDADAEKHHKSELEAEAIQEAIEVGSSHDGDPENDDSYDVEKASTTHSKTKHDPATPVVTAQDWTRPDDPGNPHNWSRWKKARHFWPVAFLGFACTTGSSIISPANQDLQQDFDISRTAAIVPLSVFVIGLGLGPMIAAPLSEVYGRSLVYKIIAPVYVLFLMGSGLSQSFASLIVCRLFAGLSSGPVLAIGSGTNADLFVPKDRAFTTAMFIMMPFLGPAFGPVIGGFAAYYRGWRWTMWSVIIIAGVAFLGVLQMEETYKKIILQKRAKKLGLPPPPGPKILSVEYFKTLVTVTLVRPVTMLVSEPIVLLFGMYTAFQFSILFGYFAAYPYTFTTVYGFNTWQYGLTFLGIGVGVFCAVATCILCDRFVYQKKHYMAVKEGRAIVDPEHRLYAAMIGAFCTPIGLFWFAWTARSDIHWISPVLAGIPFALGNLSLFISAALYTIDVYGPLNGASAMAANGLLRYVLGGCFPLFTFQMYQNLTIKWATSMLGFICVAMMPIPFIFFKYGPVIRTRSRYAPVS
ncbi:unnamed protein product [Zymoseptoria tritici ST99CH_1A5]|uniref:Major facilitator superfamily (MFS) profile domain-containing protein n=2 Tax=Zymoseptoria tritici TaxID=1047171 RepID=A0A1X7RDR8_ZYMT9|nr:unnamed protein product [Zymoseptoria tritici ST99CH_3D7]SMR44102.1 unnamed protein product [Zymoseptoria tritici ST99CH_3D1]SMY19259.1 unnamed protein product [Zymoseptoria tritici ST99CH_1A5]